MWLCKTERDDRWWKGRAAGTLCGGPCPRPGRWVHARDMWRCGGRGYTAREMELWAETGMAFNRDA